MPSHHVARRVLAVSAAALPLAAVLPAPVGADPGRGARRVVVAGELVRYPVLGPDGTDVNPVLAGATARVRSVETPSGKTIVTLVVDGLAPSRTFGAHAHQRACGPTAASSGGHYMHLPSTDPAYANPDNEVWLDLTTDASGHGEATAVVDWHFAKDALHPDGANSVVIHRDLTSHGGHGHPPAGAAGPRLGCLTVPFTP